MKNLSIFITFMLFSMVNLDANYTVNSDLTVYVVNKTTATVTVTLDYQRSGHSNWENAKTPVAAGVTVPFIVPKGTGGRCNVDYGDTRSINFEPMTQATALYIYGDMDIKDLTQLSTTDGLDGTNNPGFGPTRYVAWWMIDIKHAGDKYKNLADAISNSNSNPYSYGGVPADSDEGKRSQRFNDNSINTYVNAYMIGTDLGTTIRF